MIGKKLHDAFSTWGFAYLRGHGIPKSIVEDCMREAKNFFDQPLEKKKKYRCIRISREDG